MPFGEKDNRKDEEENLESLPLHGNEIDKFFENLVFAVVQIEDKLDKNIKEELSEDLPSVDSDICYSFYLEHMLNWFKEQKGTYFTKIKYDEILKDIKEINLRR